MGATMKHRTFRYGDAITDDTRVFGMRNAEFREVLRKGLEQRQAAVNNRDEPTANPTQPKDKSTGR